VIVEGRRLACCGKLERRILSVSKNKLAHGMKRNSLRESLSILAVRVISFWLELKIFGGCLSVSIPCPLPDRWYSCGKVWPGFLEDFYLCTRARCFASQPGRLSR
jgi:hypothetical protein